MPSRGEVPLGGDSLKLPVSHLTDTTPGGAEMTPIDDDVGMSKRDI